jgi:tetratricopeptide (TPR) repeat protein
LRRIIHLSFAAASAAIAAPLVAGDVPLLAPTPEWVTPAPDLAPASLPRGANAIGVFDQQVLIDGDTAVTYFDLANVLSSPEALSQAGTLRLQWNPAHGDLTVHRLEILRGGEKIDLLKNGTGLTVLRREAGLEQQVVTGELTAIRQIEGLRIGDTMRAVFSISERDSVLRGRSQAAALLIPKPGVLGFGRSRLVWPSRQKVAWKAMLQGVTAKPRVIAGNRSEVSIAMPVAALPEMPKDAPVRFQPLPLLAATSFADWQEIGAAMAPLYSTAGTIAEGSELAKVTDALAAAHSDPLVRIAEALKLVQGEVRYQLIALGTGNYAPQSPAETWRIRYGDCKAKTLLLIAMLHRMGIVAEPVLAHSKLGDTLPAMLPAPLAFDHVFVRAEAGGESFWLDGTSMGDRVADIRDVPRFGHVLPLREKGSELVALPVRADARPSTLAEVDFDVSAGPHLPIPFTMKLRTIRASAEQSRSNDNANSEESLMAMAELAAKNWVGDAQVAKPTASYDPLEASWTLQFEGMAYPEWAVRDGRLELTRDAAIRVAFDPDRSRAAWRQLPAKIENPWTAQSTYTYHLPADVAAGTIEGLEPIRLEMPAVSYLRTVAREGATLRENILSRESGAEIPADQIGEARSKIADAFARPMRIAMPSSYPHRWDDVPRAAKLPQVARMRAFYDARIAAKPEDAQRYADRAWFATQMLDWAAAETDYGKAIDLDGTAKRLIARADVRAKRGDQAGALKDAQLAFDLDNNDKDSRAALSGLLAFAGKTDAALELLVPDPDPASEDGESAYADRSETLLLGLRFTDAIAWLDGGLAKRPSSAAMLNSRCWARALARQELDLALADCNRAIEIEAEPAYFIDSRAMVHFRAGRLAEALVDYDRALKLVPELSPSLFMRSIVNKALGNNAQAAADLAAARKLDKSIDGFFVRFGIKP